ncbi:sugar ABC transporter substrate-binding protein [Kitasatospora sp. MMS16-BH015]|uniref:sugar ABC transporter substrate-binding protein n=1 Tax=Kitasatospora sp. MMS16-BH015 TaxID=2018025 RepID=UPI000CA38E50|nr:sugar ABC transporter substrate-binding protein [Kitasatospora sp. MMS16-BH015]AUG81036.1 sugar ABC transporter substrate-binding protein [Kitasatospora sp. MMS16-BH015]
MGAVRRAVALAAAALLAVGAAAGCSSTGGLRAERAREKASAAAGGAVSTPRWKVAMVTHAGAGDSFWDTVRKGAEQAAAKDNITFLYSNDAQTQGQVQLVQAAIDQKVDGLLVTLAKGEAMAEVLGKAKAAGIPVITVNSGQELSAKFGALTHIGQDETTAGQAAGTALTGRGRHSALCVIHEQGNVGQEQRCAGAHATFQGGLQTLYVTGTNLPDSRAAIAAKLQADPGVDTVLTLSAPLAATALQAVQDARRPVETDTFDLGTEVVAGLAAGTVGFAVDQQPYLQGYEGVDLLWLYRSNLDVLGGGHPVLTGPQVLTKENAPALAEYVARGTR